MGSVIFASYVFSLLIAFILINLPSKLTANYIHSSLSTKPYEYEPPPPPLPLPPPPSRKFHYPPPPVFSQGSPLPVKKKYKYFKSSPPLSPHMPWPGGFTRYKMDEQDPESNYLRLQFSRHPGPRSGSGFGGKR